MKKYKSRKKLWIILASVTVVALAAGYLLKTKVFNSTQPSQDNQSQTSTIDYGPPSEEEKIAGDSQKDENVRRSEADNTTPPSNKKTVTPVISYAGQYGDAVEVSAYVPDIYEEGGKCTLTLTKGGSTITKEVTAIKDATTTSCPTFTIPRSEFSSSGEWTASVKYDSSAASGSSQNTNVSVK